MTLFKKTRLLAYSTLITLLFLSCTSYSEECGEKYTALIFDNTGEIIYEKRADITIYPASLTKLMTIYIAFDAIKNNKIALQQPLVASDRAETISKINKITTLQLKAGNTISVINAIKGSIIKSFNETVVILSEKIAKNEWKFAKLMNHQAKLLGMHHTNFRNSSGLHDDGHFTTSYDLARLVLALKKDFPQYYSIFSKKEFIFNNKKFVKPQSYTI